MIGKNPVIDDKESEEPIKEEKIISQDPSGESQDPSDEEDSKPDKRVLEIRNNCGICLSVFRRQVGSRTGVKVVK